MSGITCGGIWERKWIGWEIRSIGSGAVERHVGYCGSNAVVAASPNVRRLTVIVHDALADAQAISIVIRPDDSDDQHLHNPFDLGTRQQ